MSDISTFVRRGTDDTDAINRLQALITPLAFPDPEADSINERVILSSPKRLRTLTYATGLDITTSTTVTRDRLSNSYSIVPDVSSSTAYPVTNVTTGTIIFGESSIIKGGCGALFDGSQYITIPHDSTLQTDFPIGLMFTFKSSGTGGSQAIYCKKNEAVGADFDENQFNATDFDMSTDAIGNGIYVEVLKNDTADFDQVSSDFDTTDFNSTTQVSAVRVHIADGTNEVDFIQASTVDLFDGNIHTIAINISNASADFNATDFNATDFDFDATKTIEVWVDKVSRGSTSTASITGSLLNSRPAYFGARDNGGVIDSKLRGYMALFEIQKHNFSQAEINSYHDDDRLFVTNQLNAIHFCGDESTSVLDSVF
tara:strand:- start:6 stop:1115 length:1110 start_codon:yes stop_codon:yes gene_type:complete